MDSSEGKPSSHLSGIHCMENIQKIMTVLQNTSQEDEHWILIHDAFIEYHFLMKCEIRLRTKYYDTYKKLNLEEHKGHEVLPKSKPNHLYKGIEKAEGVSGDCRAAAHKEYLQLLHLKQAYHKLETKDDDKNDQIGDKMKTFLEKPSTKDESSSSILHQETYQQPNTKTIARADLSSKHQKAEGKSEDERVVMRLMSECETLKEQIKAKDIKIDELTRRLSHVAGNKLLDGNPNIADLSDKYRPTKLGEMFGSLYDDQWCDAYEIMKKNSKSDDDNVVDKLQKIVSHAYDFCLSCAESQLKQLQEQIESVVLNALPKEIKVTTRTGQRSSKMYDEKARYSLGYRYIKEYRKATAEYAVHILSEHFRVIVVPEKMKLTIKSKEMMTYVHKCIELIWLMCVQDPPMCLKWARKKEKLNPDLFKCYSQTGQIVKFTVWPAVLLHADGPVISKGYVRAE